MSWHIISWVQSGRKAFLKLIKSTVLVQLVSAVFWQDRGGGVVTWKFHHFLYLATLPDLLHIALLWGLWICFYSLNKPFISSISCIGNVPTAGLLGTQSAIQAVDKVQTAWNWTNVILFSQVFKHLISNFLMISGSSSVTSNGLVLRDVQTIKDQAIQFVKWVIYVFEKIISIIIKTVLEQYP